MPSILSRLFAEPEPLPALARLSWNRWLVVGVVCIGAFVGQLDATIVQLALPTLGRTFDVPLQSVSWVALCYLLAYASFLPIFGRLCEMFGRKTLYILGYAVFVGASALCGLVESFELLLVFRFLQGIGGSMLGANSISILVNTIPSDMRGRALGYYAAAQAIGMSAGPAIGGLLLSGLGWRWIFWISVPFGIVAVFVGWIALPRTTGRPTTASTPFDMTGALLIGPALILTVFALNHSSGSGTALLSLGAIAVAILLFSLLARHERRTTSPLIDPALLRVPAFYLGDIAVGLSYALLYGIFFLMSFALEHGYAESPAQAGLRLAIVPVALGVVAPFSSQLRERIGGRWVIVLSMGLCMAALLILILTTSDIAQHRLYHTIAFALFGAGLGTFIAPNATATLAAAPEGRSGAAGSLVNLMRSLGTSFGVAVGAAVLSFNLGAEANGKWMNASPDSLLDAVRLSLPVLVVLAVLTAGAALFASRQRSPRPLAN